jgi:hypothetical protein
MRTRQDKKSSARLMPGDARWKGIAANGKGVTQHRNSTPAGGRLFPQNIPIRLEQKHFHFFSLLRPDA